MELIKHIVLQRFLGLPPFISTTHFTYNATKGFPCVVRPDYKLLNVSLDEVQQQSQPRVAGTKSYLSSGNTGNRSYLSSSNSGNRSYSSSSNAGNRSYSSSSNAENRSNSSASKHQSAICCDLKTKNSNSPSNISASKDLISVQDSEEFNEILAKRLELTSWNSSLLFRRPYCLGV